MDDATKRAAAYWSAGPAVLTRTRWWESHTVVSKINQLIGGAASAGTEGGDIDLLTRLAAGKPYARGVSVGCGTAHHELKLLGAGVVEHFTLFEIAPNRIEQIHAKAAQAGLASRIEVVSEDAFAHVGRPEYDLVYWKDALHHMPSAFEAVGWSHAVLRPGGLFYMNDFVGPTRMQWTDRQLDLAARVRAALPMDYLRNPRAPEAQVPLRRARPTIEGMLASDPSECADSASILPSLRARFPDAHVIPTSGIVYMLALNDILANTDETNDAALLSVLMEMDAMFAEAGDTL